MTTFMEFLGHRKYGGATFLNALLPKRISALIHKSNVNVVRVVDNEEDYLKFVNAYSGRAQIYVGLNPVRNDLKRHSTDEDVTHLCNIYIDLDCEKPEEIDEDAAPGYPHKAKDYAAKEGDLERLKPHIETINTWLKANGFKTGYHDHTGNGHRWILPIPAIDLDGYTKDERDNLQAKVKAFLKRVADECGIVPGCGAHIDNTTDFRRITGVPGTLNLKLETEARKNRIREPFRGAERDEDVALYQYILNTEITQPEPYRAIQQAHGVAGTAGVSLEYWMTRDPKLKRLYEGDTSGYPSRSEAEMALATKLVFYRFNESEIEDILLSAGTGKAAEEKRKGHTTYLKSTIKKAFELETERVGTPKAAQTGFDVSPDDFLVGDKKTFDANRFAKWLINGSGFTFVTLSDTEEVLWYDGGVYRNGGEATIRGIVEQVMDGFKVTKHAVNEVIGHIQRRTYVEREAFDKDKRIINLKNGLYDTRTGELMPHTPDYLSTVRIPVAYDPDARCPAVDQFLSDVLDADDIETAIEWFGYVLEPDYWIQKMLMLLGEGENGKSTFLSLLSVFIGEQNYVNESIHQLVNNRFRVANLYGKLANIHADISDNELTATGILKLLSGGDRISAEKKGKSPFTFKNFARLIFSANRLPRARDDTDAWYRRWTFINFTRKFGKDPDATKPADPGILDSLTTDTELSGLLNRALDALKGLHERGGFSKNLSTEETRRIYTRLSDPVAVFIEDYCMIDPHATVKRSTLFSAYVEFCRDNQQAPIGQAAFTKRIKDMGKFSDCWVGSKKDPDRGRGWRGLNIDESILNEFGTTLGTTLGNHIKTVSSDAGTTHTTLQNPTLANNGKEGGSSVEIEECGKKGVVSVVPSSTDSDLEGGQSVVPSVVPNQVCGSSDDRALNLIRSAIYRLGYVRSIHEFTPVQVLMELPKGTGMTVEMVEQFMIGNAADLKIECMNGDMWRQVSNHNTKG